MKDSLYDIAILGAGASGLLVASNLNNTSKKICLIDSNSKIGEKIKVSGGGKCNITNKFMSSSNFLGDTSFVEYNLNKFNEKDLLQYLNKNDLHPFINEKIVKGTYFCKTSKDVIKMFNKLIPNIDLKLNTKVLDVKYTDIFEIQCENKIIKSKKLIVASGGKSYPIIGASDIGFKIAEKFGHEIIRLDPALVGFTVQKDQFWFKDLSGLSIPVKITVNKKQIEGDFLFTHKGCSGPAVLTASLYWSKGPLKIDFQPNKNIFLPKRLKKLFKEQNIDIHNYAFSPAGNFGFTKAEVTKGGVNTNEIDMNTFESKLQKDLYFVGEVLDVTGELGGYNFQWAFTSAYNCSKNLI